MVQPSSGRNGPSRFDSDTLDAIRARLIALNLEPVDLPFDVIWQPRPFGHVARVVVETDDPRQLRLRLLEVALGGVVAGPLAEQPARLVMMDVDSTSTTTEAIGLLAEHAGAGELVALIAERAMRGELDFAESLRERVATLQGLPVRVFNGILPRITLSPGAWELVATLYEAGVLVGVTSGGFTALVAPLAEELGLDFFSANELEIRDRALTGRVIGTVVDRGQKARDLTRFAATLQVPLEYAVAMGDGANGLGAFAAAGLGAAYRAKPVTAAQADAVINFPRLDAVTALILP